MLFLENIDDFATKTYAKDEEALSVKGSMQLMLIFENGVLFGSDTAYAFVNHMYAYVDICLSRSIQ